MGDLLDLASRVVGWAGDREGVEAFAVHSVDTSVTAFDGEVESLSSSETRGVGVRVVVDGRMGFASTSDVTDDGLAYALSEARSNAALGTPDPGNVLPAPAAYSDVDGIFVGGLESVEAARKVSAALELERLTRAAHELVSGVDSATYGDSRSSVAIASTAGVAAEYARTDVYAYVAALARTADETQTGLGLTQGRSFDDLDLAAAAHEAAVRATRLLGARKPATARVPVVFDPLVTASFLGVLASALTAEAVQKGRSLFASRVGEPVARETFSLVDDGRITEGAAAAPFDDEGVPTRRTPVVEHGVLQGFLHNTETAARAGGSAASTGNASRSGFNGSPGVAPTNLYLDGVTVPPVEILARAEGGLYVQDVSGLHSGTNPVSGEFSVGATGLWIRGGALEEPVREVTVSSTLVEMLLAISALGDDRRFFPFGGSYGGATALLAEMTVAGA
ncbi:MAG TPA: TldD/PmbA family protein [Mycobacteriales bacterium]|jgi:PmbA protein|nr:TldD/PmbA family protein [Mycobacteriales bacterium]